MHSRNISLLFFFLIAGWLVPACTSDAPETQRMSSDDTLVAPVPPMADPVPGDAELSSAPAEVSYPVRGVIRSITPSGSHLVVEHGAIADYMDAMTMSFALSDTASTGNVAPGDSVGFMLVVTSSGSTIHSIQTFRQP